MSDETIEAPERFRRSGRKVILVTGRGLADLAATCPRLDLFESIVLESGALLYNPHTHSKRLLGQRPSDAFVRKLGEAGVDKMRVGEGIVGTWRLYGNAVLRVIREYSPDMEVILNKEFLMILPPGVNKNDRACGCSGRAAVVAR